MNLYVGVVGNNYWSSGCGVFSWQATYNVVHPEAIVSATLEDVVYDDHTRIYYDGNLLYTGSTGWGLPCDLNNSWVDQPHKDVTSAFNSTGNKVFRQDTLVGDKGEGYSRIRLHYDLSKLITRDQWNWNGPDCQNLANAITDGLCQAGSQLTCSNDPGISAIRSIPTVCAKV